MSDSYVGALATLSGVSKRRGRKVVLDGVSLAIEPGTVIGIVGPNGAGKSTLLRLLAGFTEPTEGNGCVLGHAIGSSRQPTPFVGYMPERPGFVEHLSGPANLRMLAAIRGQIGRSGVAEALGRVGLDPSDRKPVRAYSLGMRQRLSLAQATMERPQLLLLDEPTNGLDPHGVVLVRETLRANARAGAAVVISSHLLAEVETLCDRVLLLSGGRLAEEWDQSRAPGDLEAAYLASIAGGE